MKPYKNLFIDLDDTLLDTAQNNRECLEEMYADYHWDRYYASFEAFYSIYMPHNLDLCRRAVPLCPQPAGYRRQKGCPRRKPQLPPADDL